MDNLNKLLEDDIKAFEITEIDLDLERAKKNDTQVANWVGTWNNPTMTDEEFLNFLNDLHEQNILEYAIFQREKGEECGTIHFQYFLTFKHSRRWTFLKKTLPDGCWFKPMYSEKTKCRNYCSKPDTRISEQFYEVGTFVEVGGRSDLAKIDMMLEEGVPLETIARIFRSQAIIYSKQLKEREQMYIKEREKKRFRHLNVYYIWGKTGTGKTRYVMEKHCYDKVYRVTSYDNAFDYYNGEEVILFDEFRSSFKITEMLNYLDGYPLRLPCRYYDKYACFTTVYIVTNIPFEQQYSNVQLEEKETFNAFKRRITKIYNFDNVNDRSELLNGMTEQLSVGLLPLTEEEDRNIFGA